MTVRFQDVCINTSDPSVSVGFWSAVLGWPAEHRGNAIALREHGDGQTIWLNVVPESKQGKSRVHLDLNVLGLDDLTAQGATVLDDTQRWTLFEAPDGVEFCAFVREPARVAEDGPVYELVVDCADPGLVCRWWAEAFGVSAEQHPDQPWWWLGDGPNGPRFGMVFQWVPEPKTAPNWIHWDVRGDVDTLVRAGATRVRSRDTEISWDVLADPEGNEFCVFSE